MKDKTSRLFDIALFALACLYFIGTRTFLRPCLNPMENGMWMTCHWAGQALSGLACVLAVTAAMRLLIKSGSVRLGMAAAMVPEALLTALLPGNLIGVCAHEGARCVLVTRPGAIVFGVLIAILSLADALLLLSAEKKAHR